MEIENLNKICKDLWVKIDHSIMDSYNTGSFVGNYNQVKKLSIETIFNLLFECIKQIIIELYKNNNLTTENLQDNLTILNKSLAILSKEVNSKISIKNINPNIPLSILHGFINTLIINNNIKK